MLIQKSVFIRYIAIVDCWHL